MSFHYVDTYYFQQEICHHFFVPLSFFSSCFKLFSLPLSFSHLIMVFFVLILLGILNPLDHQVYSVYKVEKFSVTFSLKFFSLSPLLWSKITPILYLRPQSSVHLFIYAFLFSVFNFWVVSIAMSSTSLIFSSSDLKKTDVNLS